MAGKAEEMPPLAEHNAAEEDKSKNQREGENTPRVPPAGRRQERMSTYRVGHGERE